jgi:Heparinase II/III-like protein/Heparinase II/III N-terminus
MATSQADREKLAALAERLRRAGPWGLARAFSWRAGRIGRGVTRGTRLLLRPLSVSAVELEAALGGVELAAALSGTAATSLPLVTRFERSLKELGPEELHSLTERADRILAHRFDLLGSGPTDLGTEIDWSRDFIHGHRWPVRHRDLLEYFAGGADIKVPWELSRFQHLPLLAAAFRASGERRYLDEIGAQLEAWIEANPVEFGVNWLCTMDVAIRAANWVAAMVIAAPEAAATPWADRVARSLLLHGRFIRRYPEYAAIRGNHYLADVVGLAVVGSVFAAGPEGRDWLDWCRRELIAEMGHEVRPDGCDHEASIPYHRLVAELFLWGTAAVDALGPAPLPDWYRGRLDRMLDFTAAYTRPDGLAPQIGDNDNGRFVPLDDYAKVDSGSHLSLLRDAGRDPAPSAEPSSAFAAGGFYFLRTDDLYLAIRCGDTGLGGQGGHAHNDQLAFELCHAGRPLIEDPGTFRYAPDPVLRDRFRATASHATLSIDGVEQNPLPPWPQFPLGDRTRAEVVAWDPDGETAVFVGRHHGFESLPAPAGHERRFNLDRRSDRLTIVDRVESSASHDLRWSFPLGPCHDVEVAKGQATVDFGGVALSIVAPEVDFIIEEGLYSAGYGLKEPRPLIAARRTSRPGIDLTELQIVITVSGEGAV